MRNKQHTYLTSTNLRIIFSLILSWSILLLGSNTISFYKFTQTKDKTTVSIQKKVKSVIVSGVQFLQTNTGEFVEEEISDNDEYSSNHFLLADPTLKENNDLLLTTLPYCHFIKKIPLYILLHSWKTYLS